MAIFLLKLLNCLKKRKVLIGNFIYNPMTSCVAWLRSLKMLIGALIYFHQSLSHLEKRKMLIGALIFFHQLEGKAANLWFVLTFPRIRVKNPNNL